MATLVLLTLVGGRVATADTGDQENKVTDPVPLLELRTNGNAGWFWTLSEAEESAAVSQYGMTLEPTKLGYLLRQPFTGSQAIYRLRSNARATYLLTASSAERDSLVASGAFTYEGVIGYAFAQPHSATAELHRMNNGVEWRVVPDADVARFAQNGYTDDGPLGYVYPVYNRVGAIYFGTFDADGNRAFMDNVKSVYGRDNDWWGGVKDFAGYDAPQNAWHWPNTDFSDLKPSIGYYDDEQPATLERQIEQASSAGLRYFTFYWYWNPANGGGEQLIGGLRSFLQAANRADMDFNVMTCIHPWSNGNVSLRLPADQITKAADTIVDTYLGQPNYLRANDGRPIIEVCDDRGIGSGTANAVDTAAVRRFTDALRAEAKVKYGEDVLITLNDQLGVPSADSGFDGTQVQGRYDASRSYQRYVDTERGRIANYPGILIRGATSGFDNRPWDGVGIADPGPNATEQQLEAAFSWYDDHSIARFGTLLANLRSDIQASTRPPATDNLVLIYAWNEWHEGGHIEPNVRDGCAYLNTIRQQLALTGGAGCAIS
ncbi:glycoside hydrolase family 99-like domain-containing protein [Actinoallomurus rhizosphaericola]|uniref:glycoside hydrolase family 99-like domain-containing protein n=1 Tax=Actinoallomurus rhizosphaericola TaxID=2952536 RepID=UPI0020921CCD|nr:glycoside hydrolase family 99-like domain-containing protein [Actinoallomurus rhizosphaericola]